MVLYLYKDKDDRFGPCQFADTILRLKDHFCHFNLLSNNFVKQEEIMLSQDEIQTINKFITSFDSPYGEVKSKFLYGKCYWFARILKMRFKDYYSCEIMYNQAINHFACKIENFFFDANGIIVPIRPEEWMNWHSFIIYDSANAQRIFRDCIY